MASRYEDNQSRSSRPAGPRWGKVCAIALCCVLLVTVAGAGLVYYMGHSLFSLTNFVSDSSSDEGSAAVSATQSVVTTGSGGSSSDGSVSGAAEDVTEANESAYEDYYEEEIDSEHVGEELNESELTSLHDLMDTIDTRIDTLSSDSVYNLLLVGVDRRDKTWNGNSDSMMLVSINYESNRVSIVSLMRDTYVNVPGYGYAKLNSAYARGGGSLLCETVTNAFNVDVERYAAVDFEDMIEIVDALGGVDLYMTSDEVAVANIYITDMSNTLGLDYRDYLLTEQDGYVHCNGIQAVGYARNRFVGNWDYARTERQRYVIAQIINEVQTKNAAELLEFATKVLPLITHNIPESELWTLVTKAADILMNYTFVTDRVPYDGMYKIAYINGQDMLVPDWEETILQLHETIYGDGSISENSDNNQEDRMINTSNVADGFADELNEAASELMEQSQTETETESGAGTTAA